MSEKRKKRGRRRSNGEGSIYPRGGRWCGQVTIGTDPLTGKQQRETVYGDTQEEVREKLLRLRGEIAETGGIRDSDQLLSSAVDFWLLTQKGSLSPRAYDRYVLDLKPVKEHLAGVRLSALSAFSLTHWLKTLAALGYSTDSRRKAHARLRAVLGHCVRLDFVRQNVADMVPLTRHEQKEIHPLTAEQVGLLLRAAAGDRLEALYVVALDTGARQGELFALEWSDFNRAAGTLSITKTLENREGRLRVKTPKTKASRRVLRLSPEATAALTAHWERAGQPAAGIIFPAPAGGYNRKENFFDDSWSPLRKKAGLEGTRFHDLRHTTATLLLTAGVDLKTVAARLGHASARTTLSIYAHVLPASEERAAGVIGGFIRPAGEKS